MDIKTTKGYTLLEITVVMSIFMVLMFIGADFIITGLKSIAFGYEQDDAVKNARDTIDSLTKEIREANNSDCGDYLLDDVSPQEFSFYSNIDSDAYAEKVRYFLAGDVLERGVIKPAGNPLEYLDASEVITDVAHYVNNQADPIFRYYDTNGSEITDPSADKQSIRMVNIYLKINVTPEKAPKDFVVDIDTQIRNLKDNL